MAVSIVLFLEPPGGSRRLDWFLEAWCSVGGGLHYICSTITSGCIPGVGSSLLFHLLRGISG